MKTAPRLLYAVAASLLLIALTSGCSKAAKAERKLTAAKEYFDKANYAAAEIEYKNLLTLKPGDPAALKGLGLIAVRQGALLDACRMLSAAKEKLPADDEVGVKLAQALFELGFVPDSRKELLEVIKRTPAHGEALLLLAETSLTPEAMTETEERIASAKAADKAPVLLASAVIQLRRGQVETGTATVTQVLKMDPNFVRAIALQGTILRVKNQPMEALDPLKKASDLAGPRSNERCV